MSSVKQEEQVYAITNLESDSNVGSIFEERSANGHFGWTTIGKVDIPFIYQGDEKYCAVRILEMTILRKYLTALHRDLFTCAIIRSYRMTEEECRLINEINLKHCDLTYGPVNFTMRDLIVRLSDAVEFYKFLDVCYTKLRGRTTPNDRCGLIRINGKFLVPYTTLNKKKFVPLFCFNGETNNLRANEIKGWDLTYMKFCCKVQRMRKELFPQHSCSVISIEEIRNFLPRNTSFAIYWSKKLSVKHLTNNKKDFHRYTGQWTRTIAVPCVITSHINPHQSVIINDCNVSINNSSVKQERQIDAEINEPVELFEGSSTKGHFGWTTLGESNVPFIYRGKDRYSAVRMLEIAVLHKYLTALDWSLYNCTFIQSFYITKVECRLINEINFKHCDQTYGRDHFTVRDLIVRLSDAVELYKFLDVCYTKLNGRTTSQDRCGMIHINKEFILPYTILNEDKFVPLFCLEGETDSLREIELKGWDLSYLKFCCKMQGIRTELYDHDSCTVISFTDLKNFLAPDTLYEDYWPNMMAESHLLINGPMSQWTLAPAEK